MRSSARKITGVTGGGMPLRQGRFSRAVLVSAWVVFWLNTALFPCCESLAAAFDGHSDSISQSTPVVPAHHSDETHAEHPDPTRSSQCDFTLNAEPVIDTAYAAPQSDRVHLDWFAVATLVAPDVTAVNHFASRPTIDYHPPPAFRRHPLTQRLLI